MVQNDQSITLPAVRATFGRWFGRHYDQQFLDAVLAVAAAGIYLDLDPAWLNVIAGPGAAKTETLASLEGAGCFIVSTLSGEASLLSGTPQREVAKDATGGLLRQVGTRGVVVIKDFTSILSMKHEKRAEVLAALREVYDGHWVRTLGTDGGRTLDWSGRCVVLTGCTGEYDSHHGVIAAMGDRFLLIRLDCDDEAIRRHAAVSALRHAGDEKSMRAQLQEAVGGLLGSLDPLTVAAHRASSDDVLEALVDLADFLALSRSEVARDSKGEPAYAHPPEMGTRVGKQLLAVYQGALLIGMSPDEAMALVHRITHDSIPPNRRKMLLAVTEEEGEDTRFYGDHCGVSWHTSNRVLTELALLGLVESTTVKASDEDRGRKLWTRTGKAILLDTLRGVSAPKPQSSPETSSTRAGEAPDQKTAGQSEPVVAARAWGRNPATDHHPVTEASLTPSNGASRPSPGDSWPEVARCVACLGPLSPEAVAAGSTTHERCAKTKEAIHV